MIWQQAILDKTGLLPPSILLIVAAYAFVFGLSKFTAANARHNLDDCCAVHVYLHGDFHSAICG